MQDGRGSDYKVIDKGRLVSWIQKEVLLLSMRKRLKKHPGFRVIGFIRIYKNIPILNPGSHSFPINALTFTCKTW